MCIVCTSAYSAMAAAAAALYWDESLAADNRQWVVVKAAAVTKWITTAPSGAPSITISIPATNKEVAVRMRGTKDTLTAS